MGLTESYSNKSRIEQSYKHIRRYTSQSYGDLTVVQHKQTKQQYALKQIITENSVLVKLIEKRHKMSHKNLVSLQNYTCTGDQSLCSSLKNFQILFKYYPKTLDKEMQRKIEEGESFSDTEISKMLIDAIDCLKYLQNNEIWHLLGNMKSLLYDPQSKSIKLMENQDITLFSRNNQGINMISLIHNKKLLPFHPRIQPKDSSQMSMSQQKIVFQNIFVLGLIALGLCFLREPIELGIFGKTSYNFQKVKRRVTQIKHNFPKTHKIISILLFQTQSLKNYAIALATISQQRKSFSKQNDRGLKLMDQPLQKSDIFNEGQKLSKYRQLKKNNIFAQRN